MTCQSSHFDITVLLLSSVSIVASHVFCGVTKHRMDPVTPSLRQQIPAKMLVYLQKQETVAAERLLSWLL